MKGTGWQPTATDGVDGGKLTVAFYGEHAEVWVIAVKAVGDGALYRLALEAFHLHLHVALAAAYPYLADEDIVENGLLAVIESDGVGTAGSGGVDGLAPAPIMVAASGVGALVPGGGDFHGGILAGVAPKIGAGLALEHHAIAKHLGQSHFAMAQQTCQGKNRQ